MTQNKTNREPSDKTSLEQQKGEVEQSPIAKQNTVKARGNLLTAISHIMPQRAAAWISGRGQKNKNKTGQNKTDNNTADDKTQNRSAFSLSLSGVLSAATRTALDGISGLISMAILWLGILMVLMNRPSIDLTMFKPHYEKWFSTAFAGNTAQIENYSARWVPDRAEIEIRADDIIIGDESGQTESINTLRANFALPANIFQKPVLRSIHIDGGMMTIIHGADKRYRIGLGKPRLGQTIGPVWTSPPSGDQKQAILAAQSPRQSKWSAVRRSVFDRKSEQSLPGQTDDANEGRPANKNADQVKAALLGLETINISQSILHYQDDAQHFSWSFRDVDGHYKLIDDMVYVQTKGLVGGHEQDAPFSLAVRAKLGGPDLAITLASHNIRPTLMAAQSGPLQYLENLEAPIDLNVDLSLISSASLMEKRLKAKRDGSAFLIGGADTDFSLPEIIPELFLERLSVSFKAGQGKLKTGESFKPFERASIVANLDLASQSIHIPALHIQSQALNIEAQGKINGGNIKEGFDPTVQRESEAGADIDAVELEDGLSLENITAMDKLRLGFDFDVQSFRLNPGQKYDGPIMAQSAKLVGRLDTAQQRLELAQMDIDFGAYQTRFQTVLDRLDTGEMGLIQIDGVVDGVLSPNNILSFWPNDIALGARNWVQKSLIHADLTNLAVNLAITDQDIRDKKIANDHVNIRFDTDNVDVRYMRAMPWLRGTKGQVRIRGNDLYYQFHGGEVGGLAVKTGVVDIPAFSPKGGDFTIDLNAGGSVAHMLALSNHAPFKFADRYGIVPDTYGGSGHASLKITRPLLNHYDKARLKTDLRGQFSNVSLPASLGQYRLNDGELSLRANRQTMDINGPIKIGQWQGDVQWHKEFKAAGAVNGAASSPGKFRFAGRINRQNLDQFGIGLRRHFGGHVDVALSGQGDGLNVQALNLTADFKQADLNIGNLWQKAKGQDGMLTGLLVLDGQSKQNKGGASVGSKLQDFEIKADGLDLAGTIQLASDLRLQQLDVSRAKIEGLMDASLTAKSSDEGVFVFDVTGKHFNLSPWVDKAFKTQSGLISTPMAIRAKLQSLALDENYVLRDVKADYSHNGQSVVHASLTGQAKAGAFTAKIARSAEDGKRLFSVNIPDAGHATKTLLGLDSTVGGVLKLEGELPAYGQDGGVWGKASLRDFKLVRAPFFAQILSLASLRGLSDTLGGGGVAFEKMETEFLLKKGLLQIREARASGSALGLTGEGDLDLSNKKLNFDGVLVPSYTVNSILGDIPILGNIMVGKKGEGMFALNYAIKGPFDSVQISVNPLSALTPGFLRRIFDVKREKIKDEKILEVIEQQKRE